MDLKQCIKCHKEYTINNFYLSRGKPVNTCKICDKERIKNNYKKNPETKKQKSSERYYNIREELNFKKREITRLKNSNVLCLYCHKKFNRVKEDTYYCSLSCWQKDNRLKNLEEHRQKSRELYETKKNDDEYMIKKRELQQRYYKNNSKEIIQKTINYTLKRYKQDPIFNIICKLRRRITKTLKSKNIEKNNTWNSAYGCSPSKLKKHIEQNFTDGMSWDKVLSGEIHIDHIKPISLATTEEEVYELNHFTNLQPLWAEDNIKKSNKILT